MNPKPNHNNRSIASFSLRGAILICVLLFPLFSFSQTRSIELITNGDFSAGNTGFSSDYYSNSSSNGGYWITSNPRNVNWNYYSMFDHTVGNSSGSLFAGNAATNGNSDAWETNISVVSGQTYTMTVWVTTILATNPSTLAWFVNGNQVGSSIATNNNWQQLTVTFTATSTGLVPFSIRALTTMAWGNTFALDDVSITTEVSSTCSGTIFDTGGSGGNYSNNQNYTETYCSSFGENVRLTFSQFDIERNFDFLTIYDGTTTTSNLIGTYTDTNSPGTVTSTNGCLTLRFTSDYTVTAPGWQASISCVDDPACNDINQIVLNDLGGGTDIDITSGATLFIGQLPTNWNIEATTSGSTGSIRFEVIGDANQSNLENNSPYRMPNDASALNWGVGTYNLIVTAYSGSNGGGNICDQEEITLIIDDCAISNFSLSSNSTVCTGSDLNLTATGGGVGATYSWTGPNGFTSTQQNPTLPGITEAVSGNYFATVTNTGCSATASTAVSVWRSPVSSVIATDATCGSNDGTIVFSFNDDPGRSGIEFSINGQSSYGYNIGDDAGSQTISNIGPGTYDTWVRWGNNQCPIDLTDVTVSRTSGTLTVTPSTTICSGTPTTLSASLNNAVGTTTYSWSNGLGTGPSKSVNPTSTVSYSVNGEDSEGCTAAGTINIGVNSLPNVSVNSNSPVCDGGDLNLTSSGGNNYSWQGPNSFTSGLQNPTVLNMGSTKVGAYTVTVIDANLCQNTAAIGVITNSGLTVTASSTTTDVCSGETIFLSSSGADNYVWSGPGAFTSNSQNPSRTNVSASEAGTYTVTGSNSQGCTASATVLINVTTTNPLVSNDSPKCTGESINFAASGGTQYVWSGPNGFTSSSASPTVSNATTINEGTYSVVVSQSGQCPVTATSQLSINSLPNISVSNNGPVCFAQNVSLSASGGVGYTWAGPNGFTSNSQNPTITNLTNSKTGTYTVTVSNAAGCTAQATTQVSLSFPSLVLSSDTALCQGGDISLSASGATSYNWSGPNSFATASPSFTITNATATESGVYSITVSNSLGCTATSGVVVTVLDPTVTIDSNSPVCTGDSLKFGVLDWDTYSWTGPAGFSSSDEEPFIALPTTANSGVYNVTVSVAGCTSTASTSLIVRPLPTPSPSSNEPVCIGESLNLSSTSASSYSWSGPDGFSSSQQNPSLTVNDLLPEGTYTLVVTNTFGCLDSSTVNVDVSFVNPSINPPGFACIGNNFSFSASGGTSYFWTGPNSFSSGQQNPSLSNLQANKEGIYSVTITNAESCTATQTTSLTASIPVATASSNSPVCEDLDLELFSSGGVAYDWDGPANYSFNTQNPVIPIIKKNQEGTYEITVTDSLGCTATAETEVIINEIPNADFSANDPICAGENLELDSDESGLTYNWAGPNGFLATFEDPIIVSATGGTNGIYTLQVTDGNGCINISTLDIEVNSLPNIAADATIRDICVGQTLNLLGTGGDRYNWTGPNGFVADLTQNPIRTNATVNMTGIYTLTARIVPEQCTASATVAVSINTIPPPPIAPDVERCGPGAAVLTASGCSGVYTWYNTNSSTTPLGTGDTFTTPSISSDRNYYVDCTEFTCPSSTRAEVFVDILPLPTATASVTQRHCVGSTSKFTGGGNNVASYAWSGPQSWTSNEQSPTKLISASNQAGVYTITTTRDNGCTATATTNLTVINDCSNICNSQYVIIPTNPTFCTNTNGQVYIYATNSYETSMDGINWNQGSVTFNNLGVGNYFFYVRDRNTQNICQNVSNTLVSNTNTFFTGENVNAASDCFGSDGSIQLLGVQGSDDVTWKAELKSPQVPVSSLTNNTIENLEPGSYYVKVSRANEYCYSDRYVDVPSSSGSCETPTFCDDTNIENLFPNGDFGSGANENGPVLTETQYGYTNYDCFSPWDSFYAITNNTDCDGNGNRTFQTTQPYGWWQLLYEDHTPGDTDGYMMVVNAGYTPNIVIEKEITGLCPNTQYNFSAWLLNISPDSPILPDAAFIIDGVIRETSGGVSGSNWQKFGFSFKTGAAVDRAVFALRNRAPGGFGNNFIIDDIKVSKCPLDITLSGTTVACLGGGSEEINASISDPYEEHTFFKWEKTDDNGATWQEVAPVTQGTFSGGSMDVDLTLPTPIVSALSGRIYRIRLATTAATIDDPECSIFSALTQIIVPPIELNTVADLEKCIGSGDVTLSTVASGGTEPYTFTWDNGAGTGASVDVNPPTTTTYIVNALDADNCPATDTVLVTVEDQPTLTVSIDQDSVCLNGNTEITARVVGGSGDFQFTWYESTDTTNWSVIPGVVDSVLSPNTSSAGLIYYQVYVEDLTFDCNDATSNAIAFTVVPLPLLDIDVVSSPVCLDGVATLSADLQNGIGDISYQWYESSDNVNFNVLSNDTLNTYLPVTDTEGTLYYRVEAQVTASGCGSVSSSSTALEVLPVFDVDIAVNNAVVCIGAGVSFSSDTTSSTGTISYQWNSSTDNINFSPIVGATSDTYVPSSASAGLTYYELEATASGNGCGTATSDRVSVEVLPVFEVTVNPSDAIVCIGGDVTLDADTSNGTGSVSYQWYESSDNVTFTAIPGAVLELYNAPSGTVGVNYYRVDATASGPGCGTASSASVSVEVLPVFSVDVNLVSDTVCVGGSVTLIADTTNGTGTVTYQWQASVDNVNFTNLSGETGDSFMPSTSSEGLTYYRVLATASGSGCGTVNSSSASIVVLPVFDVDVSLNNSVLCLGGSAVLTADTISGTGTITYQWYDSNDNIGFSAITGATNLSYSAPTGAVGTTYYRVEATASGNGCGNATSSSASVEVLPVFDVNVTLDNAVICIGGSATLTADTVNGTGTVTYQWNTSTDGVNYSPISGATGVSYSANTSSEGLTYYSVSASASGSGCGTVVSDAATVEVLPAFSVTINPSSALVCVGGVVNLSSDTTNGTGIVTYQWQASVDDVNFTNLAGATSANYVPSTSSDGITYYRIIATATGSGCGSVTSASVAVEVLPVFDVNISVDNALVCENGGVLINSDTVSGAGAVTFQWYSSSDGLSFSLITGAIGDSLIPSTSTIGTTYYRVEATSSGIGCGMATSSASTVEVQPHLSVNISPGNGEICLNETFDITSTASNGVGTITYQWQISTDGTNYTDIAGETNADLSVNTATAGYFYYRLNASANGVGCTATTSAVTTLRIHDYPSVTFTDVDPLCDPNTGSITFTFSDEPDVSSIEFSLDNGSSYGYSSNDNAGTYTINSLAPDTYQLRAQYAGNLCPVIVGTSILIERPSPNPIVTYSNPTCSDDNGTITFTFPDESTRTGIEFSLDGQTSYETSVADNVGSVTYFSLSAGSYDLWVRWGNGECPIDLTDVILTDQPAPLVAVSLDTVMCEGDTYAINVSSTGGTAPVTYAWNNSLSNASNHTVSPLVDTYYIVTVTDSNNCQVVDSIFVEVNPVPVVTATGGTYCEFDTIQLGATGVGQFTWTGPDTFTSNDQNPAIVSAALTHAGVYTVILTNNFSCTSSATATVVVNDTPPSPNVVDAERCGPGTLNLSASNCAGTISWYDTQFSDLAVSTGTNFATNSISESKFYFVTCTTSSNCVSVERLPVEATVNELSLAEVLPINTTCYGNIPINNGQLIATRFEEGETYSFNAGSTYNSATASSFATIPTNGSLSQSINNPTTAVQSYTIRINSVDACPRDITVEFQEACQQCKPYCEPSAIERVK